MQKILDTVNAYAAAINTMNAIAYVACFAPDSELYDPADGAAFYGHDGALAFFSQFEPLLESIRFTPGQVHLSGNHAAFPWRIEANGKNGRTASAEGIDAAVFNDDGHIVTLRGYWNAGPFVAALTAV